MKQLWKWVHIALICLMIFSVFTACSSNAEDAQLSMPLLMKTDPQPIAVQQGDTDKVKVIKEIVLSFDPIYETAIVLGKEDCLVAIKVHHLQRFRMKKIEKQLKETLEKKFPNEKFVVSSDFKIFLESVRLYEKGIEENWTEEQKEKRLQEIIHLSREQT